MLQFTSRPETMRTIVDVLSVIVEEARMKFSADGLDISVVDASHVALIKMHVDAAAFETWEASDTVLAIELTKLRDLLKLAGPDDLVDVSYDPNVGQVDIKVGEVDRSIRPIDHTLMNEPKVPELDLKSKVKISATKLNKALQAARLVGELVTLSLDPKQFNLHVQGDQDSVSVTHEAGQLEDLVADAPVKSTYSTTYLQPIVKAIDGSVQSVEVCFDDKYPLNLNFEIADGAGNVTYFLAPRIEDTV
ncbi:MAG: hypothetical protein DBX05_00320 [Candidatus Poseidoniales archaeon]|nr:MAG: hypothetical protein CBE15_00090 [Euryarchaeota archaeon TMED255]RAH08668.1 MAG: hypothetical protein CMA23_006620 [Euryarchaeota archaeon]RCH74562.1 MAG: hypothetical protein DBX05_00320 [Candidatus Poseidoniales archaeon]|tara:strand:- start:450 stop:1193 length:744 start_codon:yes stop_codon:yes gene_type:complete